MNRRELTDEEKSILVFLETYFETHRMRTSLAMVRNVDADLDDMPAIIDGHRHLYLSEWR